MATTTEAFHELITGQMEEFASFLVTQFPDMDGDIVMTKAREHCSGINLVEAVSKLPKKTKAKRATRTSTPVDPTCQCMARVWQSGSGHDQCTRRRLHGSEYCNSHAKKALQGVLACQVTPEGHNLAAVPAKMKIGLWCGRIDEWQGGKDGIPPYKDKEDIIRIEWSSEIMKTLIDKELEEGTARHAGERRPRSRKSKTPTTIDSSVMDDLNKVVNDDTSLALLDALEPPKEVTEPPKEMIEESRVSDANTDVEDTETLSAMLEESVNDEEDNLVVEEYEYQGKTYYVDPLNSDIYKIDDGEIIGKWEGDAETGSPILNR